jgi:predicted RNA binding protein YcfA (HicA-like mRNA interferase family)
MWHKFYFYITYESFVYTKQQGSIHSLDHRLVRRTTVQTYDHYVIVPCKTLKVIALIAHHGFFLSKFKGVKYEREIFFLR